MKNIVFAAFALAACIAVAEPVEPSAKVVRSRNGRVLTPQEIEQRERNKQAILESSGGFIFDKRAAQGSIVVINAQTKIDAAQIASFASRLEGSTAMLVRCVTEKKPVDFSNLDAALASASGTVSVVVTESDSLPALISIPEKKCAIVNVNPLAKDGPEKTFERTKKEIARAVCFVFSVGYSGSQGSVMDPVFSMKALDGILVDNIGVAQRAQIEKVGTLCFGMRRFKRTTYAKACQEGWAPKPQDKYQKAIWDKTHEMPTKPLTIEPEK